MQLTDLDAAARQKLLNTLRQLSLHMEQLLQTGMSTASEHTVTQFMQAFQTASGLGLNRLGSTLRLLGQEIQRHVRKDEQFSPRRLAFFLNRNWLMCQGLQEAIQQQDHSRWQSMNLIQPRTLLDELTVVTLGVGKKLVPGVFSAFEFRMRVIDLQHVLAGKSLLFSLVFPLNPQQRIHPEAFLEFDQKQKYRPAILLEQVVRMQQVQLIHENPSRVRLNLLPESTVTPLHPVKELPDCKALAMLDPALDQAQLASYQPTPFDLEIDLQTEILLENWTTGDLRHDPGFPDRYVLDISAAGRDYLALISMAEEGKALLKAMQAQMQREHRDPLFAILHYELGRRILQPLSLVEQGQFRHLMLGEDKTDYRQLLKQAG